MKKILRWVLVVPFGAIIVLFLVANSTPVSLSLDPFSAEAPALATPAFPLWIWLILAVLIGFFAGAIGMWVSDRELRIRAKADRLELKAMKKAAAEATSAPPPPSLPSENP